MPRKLIVVPQFEKPRSRQSSDASLLRMDYARFLESRLIRQLLFRGKVHFRYADTDFDNSFYFVAVLGLKHSVCEVKPTQTNTGCPTRYRTRHFFDNFTTNEDTATKFEADFPHCVRNVKEKKVFLFKFRCSVFIGVRIIKEMPGSVASGTLCSSVDYIGQEKFNDLQSCSLSKQGHFGMYLQHTRNYLCRGGKKEQKVGESLVTRNLTL